MASPVTTHIAFFLTVATWLQLSHGIAARLNRADPNLLDAPLLPPAALSASSQRGSSVSSRDDPDPFAWLEQVEGDRQLKWVYEQNNRTLKSVGDPTGSTLYKNILDVLESKDKIPHVEKIGDHFYNFWQDDAHEKGLWRRTTLEEYRKTSPAWETVLDIDALAAEEGENWVFKGCSVLDEGPSKPKDLCLAQLSRGGADAVVIREFNISEKAFVPEAQGFRLPEAKTTIGYQGRNSVLVGTDFGPGSMTSSGYPRVIKLWYRGTKLEDAPVIFEGAESDISAYAYRTHDRNGFVYDWRGHSTSFFTSENQVRITAGAGDGTDYQDLDVPRDATISTFADQLLLSLKSNFTVPAAYVVGEKAAFAVSSKDVVHWEGCPGARLGFVAGNEVEITEIKDGFFAENKYHGRLWAPLAALEAKTGDGETFPSGALIATSLPALLSGHSDWLTIFQPTDNRTLRTYTPTLNYIVLDVLDAVKSQLIPIHYSEGKWVPGDAAISSDMSGLYASAVDPEKNDAVWLDSSGFLQPPTLSLAMSAATPLTSEVLKALPAMFDATGLAVTQRWAPSKDGTQVPYFLVRKVDAPTNQPTLLYGYGGFGLSQTPYYSGVVGRAWLERGGAYALANIRGGGEFGPEWHKAAQKEGKHKSYEDFAAVAEDLVQTGVTTPKRLGVMGGSNGGLLVGNMLVQYPHLIGAVVCAVPLLDMKRYTKLLAGASWIAEYGDPDIPEEWQYLRQSSPYHNIDPATEYPPVLFATSTRDDRVHPAHARKMAAKMQELVPAAKQHTYLYEDTEGGHGGSSPKQRGFMMTLEYEFLAQTLGMTADGQDLLTPVQQVPPPRDAKSSGIVGTTNALALAAAVLVPCLFL